MIVNTSAIVLKSFSYGESSLIARCFSEKNGKVSLIIKGAKKNKSPKAPYFQPLCYIDIIYNHSKWPIEVNKAITYDWVEKGSNYLIKGFPNQKEYEKAKEKVQDL